MAGLSRKIRRAARRAKSGAASCRSAKSGAPARTKRRSLTTDKDLEIGGTTVPAGTYSLFTLPDENGAKLIINKQTGQWGTKYDQAQDLARVDLKKHALTTPAEQFTITVEQNDGSGGELKLMWENVTYSHALLGQEVACVAFRSRRARRLSVAV